MFNVPLRSGILKAVLVSLLLPPMHILINARLVELSSFGIFTDVCRKL